MIEILANSGDRFVVREILDDRCFVLERFINYQSSLLSDGKTIMPRNKPDQKVTMSLDVWNQLLYELKKI